MECNKCLLIIFSVRSGHVASWLFLIYFINAVFTGENRAACRKFTRSTFVSFFLIINDFFGEVTWTCLKLEG